MKMLKILKDIWQLKERRKHARAPVSSIVKFRIVDRKNPLTCSRIVQGRVLDISSQGLCIGTNTVQIDGLHVFHPSSLMKNRLDIEVELRPDLPPLKISAEVQWYGRAEDKSGWIYKMGMTWESLSETNRQTLKSFLKGKEQS